MKIPKIKFLLFFAIISLSSCAPKKLNSNDKKFEFVNGAEKITFELLTGNKYLEIDKTTIGKIKLENIELKNCSFVGKTLRFSKQKADNENECLIEMSPTEEDYKEGKLKIFIGYKSKGEFKSFGIELPLKKTEKK